MAKTSRLPKLEMDIESDVLYPYSNKFMPPEEVGGERGGIGSCGRDPGLSGKGWFCSANKAIL